MKIILIEDHKLICDSLCEMIQSKISGSIVEGISDPFKLSYVEKKVQKEDPDLLLIDIGIRRLIDMDGLELTKHLVDRYTSIRIAILTGYAKVLFKKEAQENGARAYLLKDASASVLVDTILKVVAGEHLLKDKVVLDFDLTSEEIAIIQRYSSGSSRQEIAQQLNISIKTLANRLCVIYEKLYVSNYQEMIAKAVEIGCLNDKWL